MADVRRFLEPGPVVLVSSRHKGQTNIMTMGWHMILEFVPSLVGCYVWTENESFNMIRKSRECVINIPTADMAATVVAIGNSSGRDIDKFAQFGLTAVSGRAVMPRASMSATRISNASWSTRASSASTACSSWRSSGLASRHPPNIRERFTTGETACS